MYFRVNFLIFVEHVSVIKVNYNYVNYFCHANLVLSHFTCSRQTKSVQITYMYLTVWLFIILVLPIIYTRNRIKVMFTTLLAKPFLALITFENSQDC